MSVKKKHDDKKKVLEKKQEQQPKKQDDERKVGEDEAKEEEMKQQQSQNHYDIVVDMTYELIEPHLSQDMCLRLCKICRDIRDYAHIQWTQHHFVDFNSIVDRLEDKVHKAKAKQFFIDAKILPDPAFENKKRGN